MLIRECREGQETAGMWGIFRTQVPYESLLLSKGSYKRDAFGRLSAVLPSHPNTSLHHSPGNA